MRRILSYFLFFILLGTDAGAATLDFLRIAPGPRPTALGESFTAIADDLNAINFNPAGLAFNNATEFHTTYSLLPGDSYLGFAGVQMPTSKIGTFALAGKYLGGTPLARITGGRYTQGDTFSPYDLSTQLSYGVKLGRKFAMGLGVNSVQESLDTNYAASALLGDLGILYRSGNGVFSFGYAMLNAGSEIKYTGMTTGEKPPVTQRTGIAFKFNLPEHYSDINIAIDAAKTGDGPMVYSIGFEHIGAKVLSLRVGYRIINDTRQTKELGTGSSLRLGLGIAIKGVGIDYAYQPMSTIGDAHRAALVLKFGGKTIKQVSAGLKIDPEIFSPNSDGIKDGTFFLPEVEKTDKVKSWEIEITNSLDKVIKKLGTKEEVIPKIVTWDGKDETGNFITEGAYNVSFSADAADKAIRSKKMPLVADMTPPEASLLIAATTFAPGSEELLSLTTIYYKMDDINGIDRWQITIYSPKNTVVRKFKSDEYVSIGSTTVSGEAVWGGRDEANDWIVPNGEYKVVLAVYDSAGNKKTDTAYVKVYVPPKVEVIKEVPPPVQEERGLKVSLSSEVLFAPGKSDLKQSAYPRLDKIIELLNAYPENKVIVEGHTDTAENREKSLELSSERAWKVFSYLVKNGVNKDRLQVKGWGFEKPIAKNTSKKGRAKNRRVEIIILKK